MTLSTKKQPIGVFDSGIGGLIALRKLAELLPEEDLLYLGDTARVPYGNRSAQTIIQYAQECTRFLLDRSVKHILVACNTITAVALGHVRQIVPPAIRIIDVIQPAVDVVMREKYQRIGVIGTRTTIQSGSYELEIQRRHSEYPIKVHTQACPLLVPIIEEGWETHVATEAIVTTYLSAIQQAGVQALILGCTYYSFLAKTIQKILPDVHLIDSGAEAAKVVAQNFLTQPLQVSPERKIECYLTDLTQDRAQQFLGFPVVIQKAEFGGFS